MDKSVINISMLICIDIEKLFFGYSVLRYLIHVWKNISVSSLATIQEAQLIFIFINLYLNEFVNGGKTE